MKSDSYIPVDCLLVDWIEIYATKKQKINIVYTVNGKKKNLVAKIKTWQANAGAEYLLLHNENTSIRLDHIIKLGDFEVSKMKSTCQIK